MANLGYPWFLDIFLVFRNFKTHLAFQDPWFLVDVSCGADRTVQLFSSDLLHIAVRSEILLEVGANCKPLNNQVWGTNPVRAKSRFTDKSLVFVLPG